MAKTKTQPGDTTAADTQAPVLPARVALTSPYGYYDDDGTPHFWSAGYETDKPDEIKDFVARGAEIETLE